MGRLDKGVAARVFDELDEIAKLEDPRSRGKALTGNLSGVWQRNSTSGRSVFGKKSKRWKPLLQASQKASERSGRLEAMEAEKRSLEARLKALEGELATSQARLRTATAEQKALSEGCQRCEQGIANLQNDLTILEAE